MIAAGMEYGAIAAVRARLAAIEVPGAPVRQIAARAAAIAGVNEWEVLGKSREPYLCWIRFAVMYVARRRFSTLAIGRALGRNHSTVVTGSRRARQLLETDPAFVTMVEALS